MEKESMKMLENDSFLYQKPISHLYYIAKTITLTQIIIII